MSQLGHLPQIGETIDRYTVLAELAHGGMAAVYAVGRTTGHFDKLLAMKVMLPHLVSEKQFVDMFVDEARIAANVQHPNVVQVFDVGEHKGTPYMVMEYLRGQSLSAVRRRLELTPAQVLEILAGAADGLHAAHETRDRAGAPLEIVHRDVSPQNVHVGYDGSIKVVDFGIAAAQGRITQTRTGEVKGKLSYAAPEQLRAKRAVDRRLDLWALGVMAWEMLSGERLFKGETDADTMYNVFNKRVPALTVSKLPSEVAEMVGACVQRNVDLRPASAAEVARVFRKAALSMGVQDRVAIGGMVAEAFVRERAVEEERIAAAVGVKRAPAREGETSSGAHLDISPVSDEEYQASLSRTDIDPPRGRSRWPGLVVLLLLGGVGTAGVLWASEDSTDSDVVQTAAEPQGGTQPATETTGDIEAEPEAEPDPTPDSEPDREPDTDVTANGTAESTPVVMRRRRGMRARMTKSPPPDSMESMDLMPVMF